MSNPKLLLCDEISLGLAPVVIKEVYKAIPAIAAEGIALVLVEQDVGLAKAVSRRLYCLREGRIALAAPSDALSREQISAAYFGMRPSSGELQS
jgi:branched-chain amino acid transport system ATP-binding protein